MLSQVEPALPPCFSGMQSLREDMWEVVQWSKALHSAYFCESEGVIVQKYGKLNYNKEVQTL